MRVPRMRDCTTQICLMTLVTAQSILMLTFFLYLGLLRASPMGSDENGYHRMRLLHRIQNGETPTKEQSNTSVQYQLLPNSKPASCQNSVGNFAFVKTHKTGSTTLRSITSRYGYTRNLSFLLSNDGQIGHFNGIVLKYSSTSSNFLPPLGVAKGDFLHYKNYNISNVHLRYSRPRLNQFMYRPQNLTLFTILRTPVEQWLSWFQYYRKFTKVGFRDAKVADAAMPYIDRLEKENGDFNQQSRDLGINKRKYFNDTLLKETVREMSRDFRLVLITEYFDESLILLRRLMCWTFEDILYVSKRKQPAKVHFSDKVKKKLHQYNHADVFLYNYFNRTLWAKIKEYGPTFADELAFFRNLLQAKHKECVGDNSTTYGRRQFVEYHSLKNTSEFCELYVNENFNLDSKIYSKQGGVSRM